MGIKSARKTSWNYIKSCFNSSAWYEAAQDHAQKAAPAITNIINNKTTTLVSGSILACVMYKSQTAKDLVKAPGQLAKTTIKPKLNSWGNSEVKPETKAVHTVNHFNNHQSKISPLTTYAQVDQKATQHNALSDIDTKINNRTDHKIVEHKITDSTNGSTTITNEPPQLEFSEGTSFNFEPQMKTIEAQYQKNTKTWKAVNAIGQGAENTAKIVGGAVVLAVLHAASNAATKIGKAILLDRSKSGIKEAVSESLEDANAMRHGFQAAGDYAIGGIVNIAEGAWNQTLGRVFNRHDDEHATEIVGDVIDADQA